MAMLDIFNSNAFRMTSLTDALSLMDYKPQFLGGLGIFNPRPIRTTVAAVESRGETLSLIQTTERGAPPSSKTFGARTVRNLNTVRIKLSDRLMASELLDIRAFGSETELEAVAVEVSRRQQELVNDIDLTWENMRLGAVQGIVTDADGSVIVDYFSEFGIAQPAEIGFNLAGTADGALRPKIDAVTRLIRRASKGLVTPVDVIYALCGDAYWDEFINHVEIRNALKSSPQQSLDLLTSKAFGTADLYGVRWVNYRGTDDNSTVAVATDTVKFFPASSRVFEVAWAPGESINAVGAPGQPFIGRVVPDKDRQEWVDIEVASYPLYICKRPNILQRARRGV